MNPGPRRGFRWTPELIVYAIELWHRVAGSQFPAYTLGSDFVRTPLAPGPAQALGRVVVIRDDASA